MLPALIPLFLQFYFLSESLPQAEESAQSVPASPAKINMPAASGNQRPRELENVS